MSDPIRVLVIDLATTEGQAAYAEHMKPKNEADWWLVWNQTWRLAWEMVDARRRCRCGHGRLDHDWWGAGDCTNCGCPKFGLHAGDGAS